MDGMAVTHDSALSDSGVASLFGAFKDPTETPICRRVHPFVFSLSDALVAVGRVHTPARAAVLLGATVRVQSGLRSDRPPEGGVV